MSDSLYYYQTLFSDSVYFPVRFLTIMHGQSVIHMLNAERLTQLAPGCGAWWWW